MNTPEMVNRRCWMEGACGTSIGGGSFFTCRSTSIVVVMFTMLLPKASSNGIKVDDADRALLSLAQECAPAHPGHGGQHRFTKSQQPPSTPQTSTKTRTQCSSGNQAVQPKVKATTEVLPKMDAKNVFSRAYHKAKKLAANAGCEVSECNRQGRLAGQKATLELRESAVHA